MIFGRPTNLWLGFTTAISGAVASTLILGFHLDPIIVGTLAGVWQAVLGALILLAAGKPPTLNPGDTFTIKTPNGKPNTTGVVSPPEPVIVSVPEVKP